MSALPYQLAHLLGGAMLAMSFALLYQSRLKALLDIFAIHAGLLAASVAWQAYSQDAPHLYVTALIALLFKAIFIPMALRRIIARLDTHREIENVVGIGATMVIGCFVVGLAIAVVRPITTNVDIITGEDLVFALSIVLLGLLMMITRRNAVTQVVGYMSIENGLIMAAAGASGMPLVVETSIAFAVLIAFVLFGVFFFRIRERFDTLDTHSIESFRGERR